MLLYGLFFVLLFDDTSSQMVSGGKYKIDMTRVTECPEYPYSKQASPMRANYIRYNRTTKVFNTNYTLSRPMDEQFSVEVMIQKWSDGGWKDNLVHFKLNDPCRQFLRYLKDFWIDFLKNGGVKNPEKCPMAKGKYRIKNYILPLHLIQDNFILGTFNVKFLIWRQPILHTCSIFYFDIVERL